MMIENSFYSIEDISSLMGIKKSRLLKDIELKKIEFNNNGKISRDQLVGYVERELNKAIIKEGVEFD